MPKFSLLPIEVIICIFEKIDQKTFLKVRICCRLFQDLCDRKDVVRSIGVNTYTTKQLLQTIPPPFVIHSNIKFCSEVTSEQLQYFARAHTIILLGCHQITDEGLKHLAGVHTINLWYCNLITDASLKHLAGVHTIDLSYCYKITDVGLKHLTGVHTINLQYCNKITYDGIKFLEENGAKKIILD